MPFEPAVSRTMRRVLFVDDEPQLLRGLQRSLLGMRLEWDMSFTTSPYDALELMRQQEYDVVVSDMLMPVMNGVDFLKIVQELHPATIRMILSGHADRELLMQSTHCAHQFMTKPCPSDQVKALLNRALKARDALSDEPLRSITSKLSSLPSLPSVYAEIQRELRVPTSSAASVGRIIERDPAMSAKILQLVNSAFFGVPRAVDNVAEAASYLGLDLITSLVLSIEVLSSFDRLHQDPEECARIRAHSANCGRLSRRLAMSMGLSPSQVSIAFLAGMLHDLGDLVLLCDLPRERDAARGMAMCDRIPLHVAETRVIGASHARIGGYLMGIWGLPPALVEAIAFHHEPSEAAQPSLSTLLAIHLASAFSEEIEDPSQAPEAHAIDLPLLRQLGVDHRLEEWRAMARADSGIRDCP